MKKFNFALILLFFACTILAQNRIPVRIENGTHVMPCEVNGLKLSFSFNSNVVEAWISPIDAAFMYKNGYITDDDFITKGNNVKSDGSIKENTQINLKSIKIGSKTLSNVTAYVSRKTKTAISIGINPKKKLGQYSIDDGYLTFADQNSTQDLRYTTRNNYGYQSRDTTIYYPENHSTYTGSFIDGKRNGYGTMTWASGDKYVGNWSNNYRTGQGTYIWASGDKYIGNWNNGNQQGKGTYIWAKGDKYEGDWKEGQMSGKGTKTWSTGAKYEGSWLNGKRDGEGTMTYTDGVYNGEWKNDKRNGYGVFKTNDGNMYAGFYVDDSPEGYGVYTWKSGDKYSGYYKNGNRSGQGTYTWANGDRYEGEWKNGKRDGEGILYYASGGTKKGVWENGEYIGQSSATTSNYSQNYGSYNSGYSSANAYSDDYEDVDYYLAETKFKTSLLQGKGGTGKIIASIPKGEYVFLSTADSQEKYRKVIYLDKDLDGYILASSLTNFSKIEVDESGNLQVQSRTYAKTASIEVYNNTSINTTITIGSNSYKFKPHEKRTISDLTPGTYKIAASSPGVRPFVSKDKLEAGCIYSWEFYITTHYQ